MITVVDADAARCALLAGLLCCPEPGCDGVLRVWSRARARRVRRREEVSDGLCKLNQG